MISLLLISAAIGFGLGLLPGVSLPFILIAYSALAFELWQSALFIPPTYLLCIGIALICSWNSASFLRLILFHVPDAITFPLGAPLDAARRAGFAPYLLHQFYASLLLTVPLLILALFVRTEWLQHIALNRPLIILIVTFALLFQIKKKRIIGWTCFLLASVLGVILHAERPTFNLLPACCGLFCAPYCLKLLTEKASSAPYQDELIRAPLPFIDTLFGGAVGFLFCTTCGLPIAVSSRLIQLDEKPLSAVARHGAVQLFGSLGLILLLPFGGGIGYTSIDPFAHALFARDQFFPSIATLLFAIGISCWLALSLGAYWLKHPPPRRPLAIASLIFIVGLSLSQGGFGLLSFFTATAIGVTPLLFKSDPTPLLAFLLIPQLMP